MCAGAALSFTAQAGDMLTGSGEEAPGGSAAQEGMGKTAGLS
jgi:hypothetical protein